MLARGLSLSPWGSFLLVFFALFLVTQQHTAACCSCSFQFSVFCFGFGTPYIFLAASGGGDSKHPSLAPPAGWVGVSVVAAAVLLLLLPCSTPFRLYDSSQPSLLLVQSRWVSFEAALRSLPQDPQSKGYHNVV